MRNKISKQTDGNISVSKYINRKILFYGTKIFSLSVPLDLVLYLEMNILVVCWHKAELNEA